MAEVRRHWSAVLSAHATVVVVVAMVALVLPRQPHRVEIDHRPAIADGHGQRRGPADRRGVKFLSRLGTTKHVERTVYALAHLGWAEVGGLSRCEHDQQSCGFIAFRRQDADLGCPQRARVFDRRFDEAHGLPVHKVSGPGVAESSNRPRWLAMPPADPFARHLVDAQVRCEHEVKPAVVPCDRWVAEDTSSFDAGKR